MSSERHPHQAFMSLMMKQANRVNTSRKDSQKNGWAVPRECTRQEECPQSLAGVKVSLPSKMHLDPKVNALGLMSSEKSPFICHLKVPDLEPLDTVKVQFKEARKGGQVLTLDILPDTGANVTAIALSDAKMLKLEATNKILKAADSTVLRTVGLVKAFITLKGNTAVDNVYVVDGLSRPLLSRRMLKSLGLIHMDFPNQELPQMGTTSKVSAENLPEATKKVQNIPQDTTLIVSGHGPELDSLMNEYPELFDNNCKPMKNGTYHIELEREAKPISTGACRTIPEPYMPAVKKELDALVTQGIIRKIDYPTPWLHPIVVVPKKGTTDIRICVDFTKLNKFVKRPVNPQPTPWETVRNLPKGTTHFAVFDALKGYHQIELDKASQDLTAFMTPFGRYIYLRLAMGLTSAGDVFTLRYGNAIDVATDGLRATEDTLIRGATTEELLINTRRFFEACREAGITLNMRKIQWDKKEVLFGGFVLDPTGYRIDPRLTSALSEFPTPTTPTDVRSFFGLANQICNFSEEISVLLAPIKSLLKKGVMFQWLPEHQSAFEAAREHLSSPKVLAYYSQRRQTRLVVDASRLNGLGFVLKQLQENGQWRPVQAGSRFLTSAETRYAMVELEMLAISWACAKTRIFTEGLSRSQFQIWTDHAPLVPILENQTLPDISNKRLQRLKMKVDHLTFETVWVKGIENVEADALSRHPCAQATPEDELDKEIQVARINVISFNIDNTTCEVNTLQPCHRNITDDRLRELKEFCHRDETYITVMQHVIKGFPNLRKSDIPEKLRPFYAVQDDLYIDDDGFLCRNGAFVVPEGLVQTYLKRLLAMHQAAPKMLARARQSVWWPYMARDIGVFAKTCDTCEENKPSNPAEIILHHNTATYAFQAIHMDIGHVAGRYYLFSIDQFSNYPHIHECGKTATTQQVIDATIGLITHFSIPEVIYSDGGPQFLENGKFDDFCKTWGIRHVSSCPYMPRSNGIAEECVKEMKKIVRANISSSGILDKSSALAGLQMFRNTPRSPTDLSPAQILFGHSIRDSLPYRRNQLVPEQRYAVEKRLKEHRQHQDQCQTGPKRELPLLHPGQAIRVQDPRSRKWTKTGFVLGFGQNEREYKIKINGILYRQNRKFLKPMNVESTPPLRQPVQAPLLPATPPSSSFPAEEFFKKPEVMVELSRSPSPTPSNTSQKSVAFGPTTKPPNESMPLASTRRLQDPPAAPSVVRRSTRRSVKPNRLGY